LAEEKFWRYLILWIGCMIFEIVFQLLKYYMIEWKSSKMHRNFISQIGKI